MKKILVVDDEDIFRRMLCTALKNNGFSAEGSESAEEALKKLENTTYDLLITDVILPGLNGIGELLKVIKDYPKLKFMVMTGGGKISSESYLKIATQMGAAKTFRKPFDLNIFLDSVKEVINEPE